MIDINRLRILAQAATPGGWYVERGNYVYGCKEVTDGEEEWHPIIARTDDDAKFIAAVNPAAIVELLDRLEEAETAWKVSYKSCHDLTEKVIPNLRDQLEAAEKERDSANAATAGIALQAETLQAERDALRAKIEAMEKQEPVGRALLCVRCSTPFGGEHYCPACGHHTATEEAVYALPGAQGE